MSEKEVKNAKCACTEMLVYGLSLAYLVERVGRVFLIEAIRNESFP